MKNITSNINELRDKFVGWVGFIAAVIAAAGYVSQLFDWGKNNVFVFLSTNAQILWLISISFFLFFLWLRVTKLNNRFTSRFTDDFTGDLNAKWDFVGSWRIAEAGTLLVTKSEPGGITKVGSAWENYTLSFEAKIINECIGVIFRARDLNNYYMLQIRKDKIRPHRRAEVPIINDSSVNGEESANKQSQMISFVAGWQVFDPPTTINKVLDDWFKVKVIVNGESVRLYLNEELAFQQDSFVKIPTGKIGFRNSGSETALIKNIRVVVRS